MIWLGCFRTQRTAVRVRLILTSVVGQWCSRLAVRFKMGLTKKIALTALTLVSGTIAGTAGVYYMKPTLLVEAYMR